MSCPETSRPSWLAQANNPQHVTRAWVTVERWRWTVVLLGWMLAKGLGRMQARKARDETRAPSICIRPDRAAC